MCQRIDRVIRLLVAATSCLLMLGMGLSFATEVAASDVPSVIFDTDMGSDCDDAGALAALHALADMSEVRLLGVVFSSGRVRYGSGTCDAINTFYGRGDLPLGQYAATDVGDGKDRYCKRIATDREAFGHDIVDDAPGLVAIYKSLLRSEPDASVTLLTVGHPHGLVHLMRDPEGMVLVNAKVIRWVAMGGGWNFAKCGVDAYMDELLAKWPKDLYVSLAGREIITGNRLLPSTAEDNPVREAYRLWNNALTKGRSSWDQLAVLFVARPDHFVIERHGTHKRVAPERVVWMKDTDNPKHYLVTPRTSNEDLQRIIEELMVRPPDSAK